MKKLRLLGFLFALPLYCQVDLQRNVRGVLRPVNGGSGQGITADNTMLISNGATWLVVSLPDCPDTAGKHLNYTSHGVTCGTSGTGAGVSSLTGTSNQITVSGATGAITISIPSSPVLPGTTSGTFSGNLTGVASGNELPLTFSAPLVRTTNTISLPSIAQSVVTNLVSDMALKAPLISPNFTGTATLVNATCSGTCTGFGVGTGTVTNPSGVLVTDTIMTGVNGGVGIQTANSNVKITPSTGDVTTPGGYVSGASSGKSGAWYANGATSGTAGWAVPAVAGTAILYLLPSTAGTSNQVLTDTGVVTCPALQTGAPGLCHQLAWSSASGSGSTCTDYPAPGVLPGMNTAGHVYCLNGAYTFSTASSISANNVTIILSGPGTTITRTSGTTDLFDFTGTNQRLYCNGGILDGGSLNGGPLVNLSGAAQAKVYDCTVQNFGTSNAAIFSNNSDQIDIDHLRCALAPFACVKLTSVNASTTVSNYRITNSYFSSLASGSAPNILLEVDQVSAGPIVSKGFVSKNYFTGRDGAGNATLAQFLGPSAAGGIDSLVFSENSCLPTATLHACYKLFGLDHSTISHNVVNDNGQLLANGALWLGDIYHSTIIGNVIEQTSGGIGINLIDGEGNTISGNTIHGFNNGGFGQVAGIYLTTAAGNCSNNVISGNTIQFQSVAGDGIKIHSNTNGFACSFNTVTGNHILGTGTASQLGITLALANSGTGVSNLIAGNQITNVPTGITNGATSTTITQHGFDTVTTKWSFSVATLLTDYSGVTVAGIPSNLANGSMLYVSDSTIANPCAGSGTGAILKRLNGANVCN